MKQPVLYIRSTKKLITELARRDYHLADEPEEIPVLQEWYGNLFRVERRKCCLFTHAATLFTCFVPGLTKPDFVALPATFRANLHLLLRGEGIDLAVAERIAPPAVRVRILKTRSRSVLGSMNDLVRLARGYLEMAGGLRACNLVWLNHNLNQAPMGALDYARPVKAFKDLLAAG